MSVSKDIKDKPRFSGVVDTSALLEPVAELRYVIHEILKKYEGYNMAWDDISSVDFLDADQRHTNKMKGDPFAIDQETGCPHIWHKMFNMMVLEVHRRRKVEEGQLPEYTRRNEYPFLPQ